MKTVLLVILLVLLSTGSTRADDTPLVAVASSLRPVWPALMAQFSTDIKPRVTFGSSGNLARQITQGAPFELFLSADQSFPQWLNDTGITDALPVAYTRGQLAWVAPPGSSLATWISNKQASGLAGSDIDGRVNHNKHEQASTDRQNKSGQHKAEALPANIKKLAIANPAFAPYGRAAEDVLKSIPSASNIELTVGENAVQALQFALSGAIDGGIVPLSLVSPSATAALPPMVFAPINTNAHQALVHAMILMSDASPAAKALHQYMLSPVAQTVLSNNGFMPVR